jgi:hypothetical protein
MHPYKRRRRTRRDMIVLGGWLFADLLLGLAMLFAVANTVGAPPPEPTPTPLPDYLATAESDIARNQASSQQTVEALEEQMANQQAAAQATENAEATRAAMSAEQRATADAQATENAIVARATIEALSTEQAANQSSQQQLNEELATTVAQATEVAAQIQAQGTEQAALAAVATENAESGIIAQGTMAALEDQLARSQSEQATREAQAAAAQQEIEDTRATSAAAQSALTQAEQQVQLNSLNPNAITQTIQVDLNGVLSGDEGALADARDELDSVLAPYLQGQSCRIGFVNISSRAPDIGQGIQLSNRIAELIEDEFPQLIPEPAGDGSPQLASESIALPNTTPTGEVELQLFLSSGCDAAG